MTFQNKAYELLTKLSSRVADGPLFGRGYILVNHKGQNICAIMECTHDLSSIDCEKCLNVGICEL